MKHFLTQQSDFVYQEAEIRNIVIKNISGVSLLIRDTAQHIIALRINQMFSVQVRIQRDLIEDIQNSL
jgi:hypothetical protein